MGVAARPLTEGVSPAPARTGREPGESLRVHDRGGIGGRNPRPLCRRSWVPADDADAAQAHAALPAAPGARRPDGAVRRLRDAGAISRAASSPSICTPAPRPGCSTSRIWASCGSPAPTRPRRSKRWSPATSGRSGPMRMRYTLLLNDAGGILDDLMATRLRRLAACSSSSTPRPQGRPISPICATISAGAPRSSLLDDRALLALAGAGRRRRSGAPRRRHRRNCRS